MTRKLPTENAGQDFIQFRGRQSSVTLDAPGLPELHFGTERRDDRVVHRPLPVVDVDEPDPPRGAVARPVAEQIVDRCHLVAYGVACEATDADGNTCGKVFDTPQGLATHRGTVHGPDDDDDGDDQLDDDRDDTDGGSD